MGFCRQKTRASQFATCDFLTSSLLARLMHHVNILQMNKEDFHFVTNENARIRSAQKDNVTTRWMHVFLTPLTSVEPRQAGDVGRGSARPVAKHAVMTSDETADHARQLLRALLAIAPSPLR